MGLLTRLIEGENGGGIKAVELAKELIPPAPVSPFIDPVLPIGLVTLDSVTGDPKPPCSGCDSISLTDPPVRAPILVAGDTTTTEIQARAANFLDTVLAWIKDNPGIALVLVLLLFFSGRR